MGENLNDLRLQLPECPLEYEVPCIPGTHTALVISVTAIGIDWQEKMLPWTLASLINNTDLVMEGGHLYIVCENDTEDRIQTALSLFDLPENTIINGRREPKLCFSYDYVAIWHADHWAFRDRKNQIKLPIGQVTSPTPARDGYAPSKYPQRCNMRFATKDMFRDAIKHLMGAQLAMEI